MMIMTILMMMTFRAGVDDNGEQGTVPDCRACNRDWVAEHNAIMCFWVTHRSCVRACVRACVCDLYEICILLYKYAP